jgi:hypothetical protein
MTGAKRRREAAFLLGGSPFALPPKQAHSFPMQIFKCPHCSAEYELIMTHISFRQRSYANCQVCWKAMYSWDSSRVPRFKLLVQPDNTRAQN